MATRVEYFPPPADVIDRFAHEVCKRLAEHDASFADHEVEWGFANFVKVVAQAEANNRNRQQASETIDNFPQSD